MHLRPPDKAFDPAFRHTAVFAGRRVSGSSARDSAITAPAAVLGGDTADQYTGLPSATSSLNFSVWIRKSDWPEPNPPQAGDMIAVDGFPGMSVVSVASDAEIHRCACRTKEAV